MGAETNKPLPSAPSRDTIKPLELSLAEREVVLAMRTGEKDPRLVVITLMALGSGCWRLYKVNGGQWLDGRKSG